MSQLEELRQIIVGDNSERLEKLKQRVESVEQRTRDVAEVLAPAIGQTLEQDDRLVEALNRPVSQGLKTAVRKEPEAYAEILYPAIAPSVRVAISQAISSLVTSINQTIESATTLGGLRTRFESIRTGVPYAELLLRKSLVYRVEHLYLIDRETGLLLSECGFEEEGRMDSDAVSAMFSAIQSFVQDSFSGEQEDRLTDFKVGSYTVWIAHAPSAMLACVFFGNAPASLKSQLYSTLELICARFAQELNDFNGDNSTFAGVEENLRVMLQSEVREESEITKKATTGWATRLVYLAIAGILAYWAYTLFDKRVKLSVLNHHLDQTPGIVVTDAYWQDGQIQVEGLQDPNANFPNKLLSSYGIGEQQLALNLASYRSLDNEVERRRFILELNPPSKVNLVEQDGQLALQGRASIVWLLHHDSRLRQLAADQRLVIGDLFATPESARWYLRNKWRITDQQQLETMVQRITNTSWGDLDLADLKNQ